MARFGAALGIAGLVGAALLVASGVFRPVETVAPVEAQQSTAADRPPPTAADRPKASTGARAPANDEDGDRKPLLWTLEPIRIDRDAQDLDRLESAEAISKYPMLMKVPGFVRATDSTTFLVEKKPYRLAWLKPIPSNHLCVDTFARRWSCGVMGRVALRNMIAGRILQCREFEAASPLQPTVVDCRLSNIGTLSVRVAASGWAVPADDAPKPVKLAGASAKQRQRGLYSLATGRH